MLVDAGITHAFVNLGSDHPSLLEAFIQRNKDGLKSLKIVTCPNEVSRVETSSRRRSKWG